MLTSALLVLSVCADDCERHEDIYERFSTENCVIIVNSVFEALSSGMFGAAIQVTYSDDEAASLISGCTFNDCIAGEGGGGISVVCSCFLMRFCYAVQCIGDLYAGFMSIGGGTIHPDTLSQLSILGCSSARAGGILFRSSEISSGDCVNCTDCRAVTFGAAISWDGDGAYYRDYPRALLHSIFSDNNQGSDCLCCTSWALVTFDTCGFLDNGVVTGVIRSQICYIHVRECVFQNNSAPPFVGDSGYKSGFLVYNTSFDRESWLASNLWIASGGNFWSDEQDVEKFTQVPGDFTDPGSEMVWSDVPSYALAYFAPTAGPDDKDDDDGGGMSAGHIVAVVFGGISLTFLLCLGGYLCYCRSRPQIANAVAPTALPGHDEGAPRNRAPGKTLPPGGRDSGRAGEPYPAAYSAPFGMAEPSAYPTLDPAAYPASHANGEPPCYPPPPGADDP
jgi:hypothetical protein